ncbi:MAG: hypothetical protein B6A08_10500 [Sorangiineae bacterium NIC37A_2]|nr:MAG: hypothetical protein B6A08_10500 [Sorangiineae bacterium NIC37A_2]
MKRRARTGDAAVYGASPNRGSLPYTQETLILARTSALPEIRAAMLSLPGFNDFWTKYLLPIAYS